MAEELASRTILPDGDIDGSRFIGVARPGDPTFRVFRGGRMGEIEAPRIQREGPRAARDRDVERPVASGRWRVGRWVEVVGRLDRVGHQASQSPRAQSISSHSRKASAIRESSRTLLCSKRRSVTLAA